ncbi:MBOAT family O-acyltransferase [Desulfoplanes formicivorans]|nr:MBOAT family O-acyltransferase [Desulfoplanes formicivorans]
MQKKLLDVAIIVLVMASLFFYSYWNPPFVLLILFSIVFNYSWGRLVQHANISTIFFLAAGIAVNLILIGYFKYSNFFMKNMANLLNHDWSTVNIFLPLGISFFTFQQIGYLVDCYKGKAKEHKFIHYALFVTFFPQLIAGPIVRYDEIMPQFTRLRTFGLSYRNLLMGIALLSMGLFKKVVIADTFSPWVANVFDSPVQPTLIEAWGGALSYTFQIYFDFSGYTDMALGLAKLFNINLPINFNSPYKATSIIDFWRRWHISLSLFFRDYLYIPLGGNKKGKLRQYMNILATMFLCGLWHGAAWTFIFWGVLHGAMACINHLWIDISQRLRIPPMPKLLGWALTFPSLVFAWVFFRADSFGRACEICRGMLGLHGVYLPHHYVPLKIIRTFLEENGIIFQYPDTWSFAGTPQIVAILIVFAISIFSVNSMTYLKNRINPYLVSFFMTYSVLSMHNVSEFLYFNF